MYTAQPVTKHPTWSPVAPWLLPSWVTSDTKTPPQIYHYTDENMELHNKWNIIMKAHTRQWHHTKVALQEKEGDLKSSIKEIQENFISTASSSSWIPASMLTSSSNSNSPQTVGNVSKLTPASSGSGRSLPLRIKLWPEPSLLRVPLSLWCWHTNMFTIQTPVPKPLG